MIRALRFVPLLLAVVVAVLLAPASAEAATAGTIRLASGAQPVLRGDAITLTGTFSSAAGRAFVIQRAPLHRNSWTSVSGTAGRLSRTGRYRATYAPAATYRYRALLPRAAGKPARTSTALTVTVVRGWRQVTAGGTHTCGIRWDRTAWCWGDSSYGALGSTTNFASQDPVTSPTRVTDPYPGARWRSLSAGQTHTCGITTNGTGWCWGDNSDGDLGIGTGTGYLPTPHKVTVPAHMTWKQLEASYDYTCGIRGDATLWCWGFNSYGEAGFDSAGADVTSPHQIILPAAQKQTWTRLSLGAYHGCAIRWNQTLWCWGANDSAQRADTDTNLVLTPTRIPEVKGSWTGLSAGGSQTCALLDNHQTTCWGANGYGQLGATTPGAVSADAIQINPPFDGPAGSVVTATKHTCGLAANRTAWCWGSNEFGQLGNATDAGVPWAAHVGPAKVGTATWRQLTVDEATTCGIRTDYSAWCWGSNEYGQLSGTAGVGSTNPNAQPRRVPLP